MNLSELASIIGNVSLGMSNFSGADMKYEELTRLCTIAATAKCQSGLIDQCIVFVMFLGPGKF